VAENDVPGGPSTGGAAPIAMPWWFWLVLTLPFAAFCAYHWATTAPATPLAELESGAWSLGLFLIFLTLMNFNIMKPFLSLLKPFVLLLLVLVVFVPDVAPAMVEWRGGWLIGIAGAAAGAAAGAVFTWLFMLLALRESENDGGRGRADWPPGSTSGPESSGSMAEQRAEPSTCPTCTAPRKDGLLFCKRCGTMNQLEMASLQFVVILFLGLGALALWGSYSIASPVLSWMVFVLGLVLLGFFGLAFIVNQSALVRASQLASSWRRTGSLTRTGGNGDIQDGPGQ
jgi:hypothetical protein